MCVCGGGGGGEARGMWRRLCKQIVQCTLSHTSLDPLLGQCTAACSAHTVCVMLCTLRLSNSFVLHIGSA